jgi:hypothetical protein
MFPSQIVVHAGGPSSFPTNGHGPSTKSVLTEARKAELLQSARRSRLHWVLAARDHHPVPSLTDHVTLEEEEKQKNLRTLNGSGSTIFETSSKEAIDKIVSQIPAAPCVQEVLQYFNNVVNDGNNVDLDSILLTIQEEENLETILDHFKSLSSSSKLSSPPSSSSSSASANDSTNPSSSVPSISSFSSTGSASTSPSISSYDLFIKKLLHPQAALTIKAIQQYITKFTTTLRRTRLNPTSSSSSSSSSALRRPSASHSTSSVTSGGEEEFKHQASSVWTFLNHVYEIMKECPLWCEENPKDFEESKSACEKFVFVKLHSFLFTSSDYHENLLNHTTHQRIEALSFITAEHLDIKSILTYLKDHSSSTVVSSRSSASSSASASHTSSVSYAKVVAASSSSSSSSSSVDPIETLLKKPIDYLHRLQYVQCPADALLILRLCSQAIAALLTDCYSGKKLPGSDELLPVMILCVKYANPLNVHTWIKYLQRYVHPSKLTGEAGYLIANLYSAVYFLDNVNADALTISPEEFESSLKASKMKGKEKISTSVSHGGGKSKGEKAKNKGKGKEKEKEGIAEEDDNDDDEESLEKIIAEYQQKLKKNSQKEYISIKATMAMLQYGKP